MVLTSGIPEDATVNTFHVRQVGGTTDFAAWVEAWEDAMEDVRPYFANTVALTGHTLKIYNLADPEPRAPVYTGSWSFGSAVGATTFPSEVALCVSFQGARLSGTPQRRRRGRIFLGPLHQGSADAGRPSASFRTDALTFLTTLNAGITAAGADFGVWSRANELFVQADNGWVDNAYDTQRRRGLAPTVRNTVTLTP